MTLLDCTSMADLVGEDQLCIDPIKLHIEEKLRSIQGDKVLHQSHRSELCFSGVRSLVIIDNHPSSSSKLIDCGFLAGTIKVLTISSVLQHENIVEASSHAMAKGCVLEDVFSAEAEPPLKQGHSNATRYYSSFTSYSNFLRAVIQTTSARIRIAKSCPHKGALTPSQPILQTLHLSSSANSPIPCLPSQPLFSPHLCLSANP
jgi:hypothetical protein